METASEISNQSDNFAHDLAMLDWMLELGIDEAITESGIDRFALPDTAPKSAMAPAAVKQSAPTKNQTPADVSKKIAASCSDLPSLRMAIEKYEICDLKQGARKTVFADGNPAARVMIIGEAPGREEDRIGKPFIGPAGQLLDKMLAPIGLSRQADDPETSVYITNIIPWRPPQNREPSKAEIEMMEPFLMRHIELVMPKFLLLMGNPAAKTLLKTKAGITRIRGQWGAVNGIPALPMLHPAYLLRTPTQKRAAWADLLALKARLKKVTP